MSQNETSGTVAVDNQKIKTKQMVLIALMTAVTCVLGPLSVQKSTLGVLTRQCGSASALDEELYYLL